MKDFEIKEIVVVKQKASDSGWPRPPKYYLDEESAKDAGETSWEKVVVLCWKDGFRERFFTLTELIEKVKH